MIKNHKLKLTLFLIILVSFILLFSLVSLNNFKEKITESIKNNYGLDISFDHSIKHSLLLPGKATLRDVKISLEGKTLLSFNELALKVQILPLFNNKIIIDSINLTNAQLELNSLDILKIKKILVEKAKSKNSQKNSKPMEIVIHSISIAGLGFKFGKQLHIENLMLRASATSEKLNISKLNLFLFGSMLSSHGDIVYGKGPFVARLKGTYENIHLKLWNSLLEKKKMTMDGDLNITYDLAWRLSKPQAPEGEVLIKGYNLYFKGLDLDQLLSGFIDSREVGLLDVASFIAIGPVGALLTNTLEASKSIPGIGSGQSKIQHLNIQTKLKDGFISMEDAALSTNDNRLAFKGNINILTKEFDNFYVHILNQKGCSRILQKVSGPLSKPDIGMTQTMSEGVISPATNLLKKTKNLLGCKTIYSGVVAHPE